MNRKPIEIQVIRDLDPALLRPLDDDEASTGDGMMLNHAYVDVRGCDASDLDHAIAEETAFYDEASELDGDPDALLDLLDRHFIDSESCFDVGVTAAVVAISTVGGVPISSCNGGWFGDDHRSSVPHILFSTTPEKLDIVQRAAAAANCGLTNNGAHAELFADELPKLLRFALEVQKLTAGPS